MIEDRSYGKAELAMLYFPTATPRVALNRLVRWINRCPELKQSLCSGYAGKFSHFYTRQQVAEIIIRKTKCFRILERNAKISKTKRNFSRLYPTPQKFKKIDRLRRNEIHLKAVRTSS